MDHAGRAHIPVLLDEVVASLEPKPGEVYADATAGLGGHAGAIAPMLAPGGTVVLNDVDPGNVERSEVHVRRCSAGCDLAVRAVTGNFVSLPRKLKALGLRADLLLADLGFASNQMDDGGRGLSFRREGPLDMRLDPSLPRSARDLVNGLPEAELAELISRFGEERSARRIAAAIAAARAQDPIATTGGLASIVRSVVGVRQPARGGPSIDPATKTFQALRIAVNDEIGAVQGLLESIERASASLAGGGPGWLARGARIGIISFHSLEDRPVKRSFGALVKRGFASWVTRKPVMATESEVVRNPRARSAKLRAIRVI